MRVLHINLEGPGLGRYGLLYGTALGTFPGITALSLFDRKLLRSGFLRDQAERFDHKTLNWSGGLAERRESVRELKRLVAAFKPDIIHDSAGSFAKKAIIWPILVRWAPLVITEHDPVLHQGRNSLLGKLGERLTKRLRLHMASHVFVHGPRCRNSLLALGFPPERTSIVRHGHLGLFDRGAYTDVARNDREILFFGELRPNKGVESLIEIADRVSRHVPDVKFIVAGSRNNTSAAWAEELEVMLEEMKTRPHFEVHDHFIPDEHVEYFFRRAGITLMPYKDATQSGVAMIAMPLRSAIVSTNVGDLPDVIRHDETGFLTEPDPTRISDLLIELLGQPARVGRVREEAGRFAMQECDWRVIVNQALHTYERLVIRRVVPAPAGAPFQA